MNKNIVSSSACSLLAMASLLLTPTSNLQAASQTWTGATDGTFATGSNWSGGAAPGANFSGAFANADTATFNNAVNTAVSVNEGKTLRQFIFEAGAGAFTFSDGTVWFTQIDPGVFVQEGVASNITFNNDIRGTAVAWSIVNNGSGDLSLNGTVTNDRALGTTLTIGGSGGVNTATGVITSGTAGVMNLIKAGTNKWVLSADNTYAGATILDQGTLELDFSAGGAPASDIISSSSSLEFGNLASEARSGTLLLTGAADSASSQSFNTAATESPQSGAYHINLTTSGSGTMSVDLGAITANRIGGFTLDLSLPAGTSATTTTANTTAGILPNAITLNGVDFAANDGAGNIVATTSYDANTATGLGAGGFNAVTDMKDVNTTLAASPFPITVAAMRFNENADRSLTISGRKVIISNGILVTANVGNNVAQINGVGPLTAAGGRDLMVIQNNTSADFLISAVIEDNGSAVGLSKAGEGSLVVSGDNTYSGLTLVHEGTLIINGDQSAATGAVSVASGATLGGDGTVGGVTTISGVHNPGNSPGLMSFVSDLNYTSGAIINWELNGNTAAGRGTNYDAIDVGGDLLTGTATINLTFDGSGSSVLWSDGFWTSDQSWLFYDVTGSLTGTFALGSVGLDSLGNTLTQGAFSITYSGDDALVSYTAVPEPSTLLLLGLGAASLMLRTRRR